MRISRILAGTVFSFCALAGFGQAQNREEKKGFGYVFFAPGVSVADAGGLALVHFGGGGEGLIKGGFGASAELGYLFPQRGGFHSGLGVFAPGILYRFRHEAKTTPFITGGWGIAFSGLGAINLVHFGGGVNHWLNERLGLRIEGRDFMAARSPEYHILQARIALLIR